MTSGQGCEDFEDDFTVVHNGAGAMRAFYGIILDECCKVPFSSRGNYSSKTNIECGTINGGRSINGDRL